ncbi:MAG: DNA topoisomerase 1 [Euryarchaeota archaeon]|nr:DNA topoisomerase 1 [Euryarchaeota archaeon]|tara:strand:- start:8954 stop:11212 length:2259 start_codon:yes stop_codon:yes gene_type:complete
MKLMILESGAKAKTVKKYLGKGWIVQACGGHVQDLPSKGSKGSSKSMWESEKGTLPEPPWGWTPGAEKKIKDMIKKAKKANVDEIYIATDPDREGEFIAWRLSIIFSDFDSQKRVTFNEITEKSVNEAINEARDIDTALVNSAKVRRFMDRLVGFECSRFSRTWKLASMGRVQTPTLGFIVERELLREKHVPINYHSVNFKIDNVNFKIRFHEKNDSEAWLDDDGKHFPDRTFDEKLANQSIEILNKNKNIEIVSVKEGKSSRSPKPPFTTDTMLQAASSTLGWSVSKTSSIAGELYNLGHVTYIRTDSTRTNEDAREIVKKLIKDKYGEKFLGKGVLGPDAKKGTNNVQDAHEAIRPTRPEVAQLTEDLNQDLKTLYKLIWARFAASQMSNSIRETRRIEAKTENFNKKITGTASWRTHPGWEVVFNDYQKDIIETPPNNNLEKGAKWGIICNNENPQLVSDETKPPRRYSESSIVQQMKKVGIGRPSTYVSTIQTLNKRKYVENNSGSLIPTDSGRTMWLEVVPFFNEQESRGLFNTDFTAKMESNLDTIEDSSQSAPKIWHDFVEKFVIINENAKTKKRSTPSKRQIELLNNLMKNMNENELANYLKGKKPNELTGDEMRETLDLIIKEGGDFPASEKQMNLIIKLSDQLGYKLEDICKIVSIDDINDLTGGKDGTASKVIDQLINESQLLPATESQVKLINKIATREELPLSDILSIADIVSIEELTKKDASKIIDTVMKKNKKSRKK